MCDGGLQMTNIECQINALKSNGFFDYYIWTTQEFIIVL